MTPPPEVRTLDAATLMDKGLLGDPAAAAQTEAPPLTSVAAQTADSYLRIAGKLDALKMGRSHLPPSLLGKETGGSLMCFPRTKSLAVMTVPKIPGKVGAAKSKIDAQAAASPAAKPSSSTSPATPSPSSQPSPAKKGPGEGKAESRPEPAAKEPTSTVVPSAFRGVPPPPRRPSLIEEEEEDSNGSPG